MAPRRYDMTKRVAATNETRRRILDATIELHTEKGIFGTSWQDIAERADVSAATVYNHFRSLDELVPACGELLFEKLRPPGLESADEIFGDTTTPRARIERLAHTLFGFYERSAPYIDIDRQERTLPSVREFEEGFRATVAGLVREALRPRRADAKTIQLCSALLDFPVFQAFRARGVSLKTAADAVTGMIAWQIEQVLEPLDRRSERRA